MKKFRAIKVDKATNIVVTEKIFNTLEDSMDFLSQIAKCFGYEHSTNAAFMYENGESGLTIR